MVILIVMNSILSNLGPRYSRRNSTTPIVLGFLLLIIAIAVATYFLTRDDEDDDDGKDKKDENTGENVPSIEDPTVTRTFLPDSSNSSESGTTETYEIGGDKTETYQIEYNGGISDITLSKNVKIGITWSNKSGFEDVYKLVIEHYVTATAADATNANASFTKTINRYDTNSTEILDNENYFKNFETNLTHEFQGLEATDTAAYSFVGTHTIKIIATYIDANNNDVDITLSDGGVATNRPVVSSDDLAATIDLAAPEVRVYQPIQGAFTLGDAVIENQEYFARTRRGVDIFKSIDGIIDTAPPRPITLIRASAVNSNQFYFKFSETEYLGYNSNNKISIDTADNKKIITLVSSSFDNTNRGLGPRHFRLSFGNDLYALIDANGNGAVKAMADIETEEVYNTLDWKLSFGSLVASATNVITTSITSSSPSSVESTTGNGYYQVIGDNGTGAINQVEYKIPHTKGSPTTHTYNGANGFVRYKLFYVTTFGTTVVTLLDTLVTSA